MPKFEPVDYDPFGQQPVQSAAPASTGVRFEPVDYDPFSAATKPAAGWLDTAADVGKSAASGVARGVAGLIGLPGDVKQGVGWLVGNAPRLVGGSAVQRPNTLDENLALPTSQQATGVIDRAVGGLHKPETMAGEYAQTVGEFLPAAAGGLGNMVRYGVVPALASETAGQLTKGTDLEGGARFAGALLGGGASAFLSKPRSAEAALSERLGPITDIDLNAAAALKNDAASQGVNLTWPEAIQQVTNKATTLDKLQRVVERSPGGAPVMREFMVERPAQVQSAGAQAMGNIAPQTATPSVIGNQVQRAAETAINDARNTINSVTRPYYQAAEGVKIPDTDFQRLMGDASFADALKAIRSDPEIAASIAHLPDNSVGVIDTVQKLLGHRGEAAKASDNALERYKSSMRFSTQADAKGVGRAASPDYATALDVQRQGRERFLEPLEAGPLGKMQATQDVSKQGSALLPSSPLGGSEREVRTAVGRIVAQNPEAARQLVRQHLETAFNEATQNLVAGGNEWGGAKFAAAVAGNSQQAKNLQAAIRALPGGDAIWDGTRRFLDVLEATGKRLPEGAATATDTQALKDLRGGGFGEAASKAASPATWLRMIDDWYQEFKLGQNTEALARIMTSRDALPLLRSLRNYAPGSKKATQTTLRLIAQGSEPVRNPHEPSATPAR